MHLKIIIRQAVVNFSDCQKQTVIDTRPFKWKIGSQQQHTFERYNSYVVLVSHSKVMLLINYHFENFSFSSDKHKICTISYCQELSKYFPVFIMNYEVTNVTPIQICAVIWVMTVIWRTAIYWKETLLQRFSWNIFWNFRNIFQI